MEVCLKLDNIKLENRPYTEVSNKKLADIRSNDNGLSAILGFEPFTDEVSVSQKYKFKKDVEKADTYALNGLSEKNQTIK